MMEDGIEPWNRLYSQVPRPGPAPMWALMFGFLVLGPTMFAAGIWLVSGTPVQNWQTDSKAELAFVLAATGASCVVGACVLYAINHKRHTWMWGDAELARLQWSEASEVDAVGAAVFLAPVIVLVHGAGTVLGHWFGRATIAVERLHDGELKQLRIRTLIYPERGTGGYGWIIQSRLWPRVWQHMASVIPGGGAQIVIPDDAMNELAEAIRQIKGLRTSVPKPTKSLAPREALKLPAKSQVTRRPK